MPRQSFGKVVNSPKIGCGCDMTKSLGALLAIGMAGLQFLAVLAVVISSYVTSERALLQHARDLLRDIGYNSIEHSKGFLSPAEGAAELAARLAQNSVIASDDPQLLEQLLFQQLQIAPQFAGIYYGSEDGDFVMVMRDAEGRGPFRTKVITHDRDGGKAARHIWRDANFTELGREVLLDDPYDPRTRSWYKSAKSRRETIWTDPYVFFTSQQPGITLAAPVLEADGIRGAVGVDIEISAISGFLANLHIGDSGKALIIHQNGDVIAHPSQELLKAVGDDGQLELVNIRDFADPLARTTLGPFLAGDASGIGAEVAADFTYEGEKYVSKIMPVISDRLPWTIAIYVPESDFTGPIKANRMVNLWIAGVVALVTAGIGLFLANYIHKPVRAFAIRSALVAQGELDPTDPLPKTYRELEKANDALVREIGARRQAEQQYGQTFDLAPRAMAQVDVSSGHFTRINERFTELTGYSAEDLSQMTVESLLANPERIDLRGEELNLNQEMLWRHKGGEALPVWFNSIVIHDAAGRALHAVVTLDDLAASKEQLQQINRLNRDLAQFARGQILGEMASGLAHELNQPLASIAQNADSAQLLLNQDPNPNRELGQILHEIEDQSLRAGDIIRALRGFIRKDEDNRAPFDLGELVAQSIHLVQPEAREGDVQILTDLAPDLPLVTGNRTQIAQVLVNLERNAIEAMAAGSNRKRILHITAQHEAGQLRVSLRDTGPGIAPDRVLFTQFETTKPNGMGLGLSLCRSIIEGHGGQLWQEGVYGEGAQFTFTLPLSVPQAEGIL